MDRTALRGRLERDRDETERTLHVIRERLQVGQMESGGELSLADQHPADAATETESRELDMAQRRMLEARLKRIADAIERLRPGRGLSVDQILGRVPWGAPEPCPCIAAAAASCTAPDCAAAP